MFRAYRPALVVAWLGFFTGAFEPSRACAQALGNPAIPASNKPSADPPPPATPTERDKAFAQLDREFAAFEEHVNLLKKVVRLVKPTVAHIEAEKTEEGTPRRGTVEEAGSGVLVQIHGKFYVLTSRHVIKNATLDKVKIHLADGRVLRPTLALEDRATDVALLSVTAPDLVAARIGNSDQVEIGDFVLAMGSPFGLSHSLTYGIISAKGRRDLDVGTEGVRFQDFMQTDAAINPGNSGGPLMNLRGEVVGINTAIASATGKNEGIGFTTPINMAMFVARQLVEKGAVARAFLGVHLDAKFTRERADKMGYTRGGGALVSGITPSSPAEAANLQVGDVIVRLDGMDIEDDGHLVNRIGLVPADKDIDLVYFRDGKYQTVRIKAAERSRFEPPQP